MEQWSFPIYTFSQALDHLSIGRDIARDNIRLRLQDKTIMMVDEENDKVIYPWLPCHKDILAKDWKVINIG